MAWEIVLNVFLLAVGFVLLVKGADWLVDGAAGIAAKLKVSSLVIGLTVVAFGTSAPEMAVSITSAIGGDAGTSIGNVIGSNIMNILLILGISSLIVNIPVGKTSRFIEIPFLIATTALFIVLGVLGVSFTWWEGLIIFALYVIFMAYTIIMALREKKALLETATATSVVEEAPQEEVQVLTGIKGALQKINAKYEELKNKVWFLTVLTVVGLALVVWGGTIVVEAATFIAEEALGIDTIIVGLTVVAFGTSLPELVTSVSAAKKGDMGIATGNIIGSNIANLLLIAGLSFTFAGNTPLPNGGNTWAFVIDCGVSILAALILWLFSMGKTKSLGKVAGVSMIAILIAYYVYLFLSAYGVIVI
ncbi:MAG: calcium/sodium antiporter [Clostridia bacterium]|nr:calcium/sodium antiporter [Clostridia bacterium]